MENLESKLIDYIDGKLSEPERLLVENEMANSKEVRKLHQQLTQVIGQMDAASEEMPSSNLKIEFQKMLEQETRVANKGKQVFFQPMVLRIAAGVVFVLLGIGFGFWLKGNYDQKQEIAKLRHEMDSTKQAMMALLANQQSASQRMLGTTVAFQLVKADDEIVNALVKAMNEDPNTNVRLAALEALGKFRHQGHVRQALIQSLAKQKDPVVQISLIQLMVEMKERSVIQELEKMTQQKEILKAVKDEAHAGILKLS